MDILRELMISLSEREKKLFKKYLKHRSNKKERKDLTLFLYLSNTKKANTEKIIKKLYTEHSAKNAHAYHSLRSYLKDQLENFILQQKNNENNQLKISRLINLAQNLYFLKKHQPAWHYLKTAEEIAIKAEEYELLNQIYQKMIEYAWTQPAQILDEVIQNEKKNREQAQIMRSMNLALSVIRKRLSSFYTKAERPNVKQIVQQTLKELGVDRVVVQRASEQYKVAMMVKVSLEEDNNYEELYKYMIHVAQDMENNHLFNKYNYQYKIEILNAICVASTRAGDYQTAEKYLQIIEEENKTYPGTDLLSIGSFMCKVACLTYTDRKIEALKVLEYLEVKYKKLYNDDDYFFTRINFNLASIHLHLGNMDVSRKCLNELLNNSNRIMRYHGLEVLLYCHLIECILAIESNNMEYANSRIVAIERKYKELIELPHHLRNLKFLKLLKQIVSTHNIWKQNKFTKNVWDFIAIDPIYTPGFEFVSFNAWLYSKLQKVPYGEIEYNRAIEERVSKGELKIEI